MNQGHPKTSCEVAETNVLCGARPYVVVEFGRKPCGHPKTMTICHRHWELILKENGPYRLRCQDCKKGYATFPAITNWWFVKTSPLHNQPTDKEKA